MQNDPDYCKATVPTPGTVASHQCTRRATRGGYCKIHHPDAYKERAIESDSKFAIQMYEDRFRYVGAHFYEILSQIAAGVVMSPRAFALEKITEFDERNPKPRGVK